MAGFQFQVRFACSLNKKGTRSACESLKIAMRKVSRGRSFIAAKNLDVGKEKRVGSIPSSPTPVGIGNQETHPRLKSSEYCCKKEMRSFVVYLSLGNLSLTRSR